MDKKQLLMIAAGGGAVTAIGSFLPWATFSGEGMGEALRAIGQSASVAGIEGDGKLTLILGLVGAVAAGALFLGRSLPISDKKAILIGTINLALAAAICIFDFLDISGGPVSVGIGLWLCVAGSVAGTAAAFLAWRKMGGELPAAVSGTKVAEQQ